MPKLKQLTASALIGFLALSQTACSAATNGLVAFGTAGIAISTFCALKPASCSSGEAQLGLTVTAQIPQFVALFKSGTGTVAELQAALALVTADVATAQNLPHDAVITAFVNAANQEISLIQLAEANVPATPAAVRQIQITGSKVVVTRGETVVTWGKPGPIDMIRLDRLVARAKAQVTLEARP